MSPAETFEQPLKRKQSAEATLGRWDSMETLTFAAKYKLFPTMAITVLREDPENPYELLLQASIKTNLFSTGKTRQFVNLGPT